MTTQPVLSQPQAVHSKDVRRAWISVALLPVGLVAAIVVGEAIAAALGYESGSGELAPLRTVLLAAGPALLLGLTPGALAVWFGERARRAGDGRGLVPALVGGALGIGFAGVNLLSYVVGRLVG